MKGQRKTESPESIRRPGKTLVHAFRLCGASASVWNDGEDFELLLHIGGQTVVVGSPAEAHELYQLVDSANSLMSELASGTSYEEWCARFGLDPSLRFTC